ncbi:MULTISPECIES: PLP-dependent aminotransferase family protein [unclassified Chryseobacterium]|uniref:MocR-like pyridoxine biosynthesis transcription factor PdxR n=1 Tax=unclassified Chryseobacterium TaxID=2593645 RepID=UPI0022698336|nr:MULTISPECIES: PLP-dependent aminotransferase family protein [unclassified Chryseobacterium]
MLRPWKVEIQINYNSEKAVYLQIADALIDDIQSGRLKKGTALPGSRKLAEDLKVNRNTIIEALNVLLNEGWLVSLERKGTFVAENLPTIKGTVSHQKKNNEQPQKQLFRINFDDGYPDSAIAPVTELARAYRQIFNRKAKWQLMGYTSEYGDLEFRKAIVQMLNHHRGLYTYENSMCITRGSQMGMYLTAQSLIKKNDVVLVENPGYRPAWKAFEKAGATLLPVRVDEDGLMIEDVIHYLKIHKNIKAIYTTPHHQYPTTVTLSLQRRLELIKLSNEYGFTIIEDDYDNEFHFGYRPVLPLASFTELQNYVYIGTMSKVVAPALRIGYLISNNQDFIEKIGDLRKIIDVQGDTIMEQAVLQLIQDGTIKRHLKKALNYYKSKRDFTAQKLQEFLKDKADYSMPEGGMAFWIVPKNKIDWDHIDRELQKKSIKILNPNSFSFDNQINGLRLSYGSLPKESLEEAIKALSELL